jgi:hypothetical protein
MLYTFFASINASTYIDPEKWNYIFADTSLNAMNFWVQIGCDIKARRTMSAKMMPIEKQKKTIKRLLSWRPKTVSK